MLELADRRGLGPRVRKDVGVQLPPRAPGTKMDEDLNKIEEKLKEETEEEQKKPEKISGKSVFRLQEIIKKKSKKDIDQENSKQNSIS